MKPTKWTGLTLVAVAAFVLLGLSTPRIAQATYDPHSYVASLHYMDSNDLDWWLWRMGGPQSFFPTQGSGRLQGWGTDWTYHTPYSPTPPRLVNMKRDFQDDGLIDPEDSAEMTFTYVVSPSFYSTTKYTRLGYLVDKSYAPNNQRPSVYFHSVDIAGWHVWEYWVYYAVNDYTGSHHEGDWEWYFIYFDSAWNPLDVGLSYHDNMSVTSWDLFGPQNKIEGGTHLKLGVDAGSQAFQPYNFSLPEGVRIQYAGYINQRQGRLDDGSHDKTFPWIVFAHNETGASGAYVYDYGQTPTYYYYGDPYINDSDDRTQPNLAPWERDLWSNPPLP